MRSPVNLDEFGLTLWRIFEEIHAEYQSRIDEQMEHTDYWRGRAEEAERRLREAE